MNDYYGGLKAVQISRDGGYSKSKSISSESRKESRERIENPNIVAGRYKLKEIFAEIGIIVNPEEMTYWYKYK